LFSLLESWISTSSCIVALGPIVILVCFLKTLLHNLSNIGLTVSSISFTHLITSLIYYVNHFPSSHLDDNWWCERWNCVQWHNVVISSLAYLSNFTWNSLCFARTYIV
jgi:hypothetical protein